MRIDGTTYNVDGNVALIGLDYGPVNALGYPLRKGFVAGLKKANADPKIEVIVVFGEGRTFPAGADISEFANGMAFKIPIHKIIDDVEANPKPVVAAVHGTALGGGCEVAMGCHYRLATGKSKFGFPEVKIGLLPGAGGTQRAPRLVGPLVALEMCVTGSPINVWRAEQAGLVDHVVRVPKGQDELSFLKTQAVYFARSIAGKAFEHRRTRNLPVEPMDDFFYENAKMMAAKTARGHVAPPLNVEAVRAAQSMAFNDGIKNERRLFSKLAQSPEASALQHIFFAQRAVVKVPGVNMKLAQPVKKVAIIGAGTMGGGIAMCFAQKGVQVVLKDIKQEYLDRGMKTIAGNWGRSARKGRWSAFQVKSMMKLIKPTLSYNDCADADLVIEAVFENMKLKKEILSTLDKICKPSCILATNTSTLDVDEIASATSRPEKVIGMHFFSPANVMMLLENVRGSKTDDQTIATATMAGKLIGKVPVLVGNCFGFVGNRVMFPYGREAEALVDEGASPYDVDKVIYKFGMAMGPFQVNDLSGLDVGYKIRKARGMIDNHSDYYPHTTADLLTKMKRLGQKTKSGWYDYSRNRRGKPDPKVLEIINNTRKQKGLTPQSFDTKTIEERCIFALINEAFKTLDDGIAQRPLDVDAIWVFGYGFPVTKGGPCYYADRVGAKYIVKRIKEFSKAEPRNTSWKISPLLQRCADENTKVYKLYKKMAKAKQAKM